MLAPYGVLMQLTQEEIEQTYSESSVRAYCPETVVAELKDGERVPALCFNLIVPPGPKRPTRNTRGGCAPWRINWASPLTMWKHTLSRHHAE